MAQAQDNLQIGNDTRPIVSKGMGTQEDVGGTGTASQSYTQGSYFVGSDGFMYQADSAIAQNATIIPSGTGKNCTKTDIAAELGSVKEALTKVQDDLTDIKIMGSTNNTGSTISRGTFFYFNGTLVRAKTSIATGATFTVNTNYEVVTSGSLNSILGYKWERISVPSAYVQRDKTANITFVKNASVCNVFWSGGSPNFAAVETEYEIGDIPTDFIPDADVTGFFIDANTSANCIYFKLTSQGKIKIYSYSASGNANVAINLTYIRYGL